MDDSYFMTEEQRANLPTIVLQPSFKQFLIDNGYWLLIMAVAFIGYIVAGGIMRSLFFLTVFIAVFCLFCQYIKYARIKYIVTPEQLIYLHGFFIQQTDYMELYRVVDYQQHRSLLQQMTGLKTVSIYSGDRSMPHLRIIGVRIGYDIVGQIRYRVELNKRRRGVYELTNRF